MSQKLICYICSFTNLVRDNTITDLPQILKIGIIVERVIKPYFM
jgi:hypothetical protein